MATKVTIIGDNIKTSSKAIEFIYYLSAKLEMHITNVTPSRWSNIELIALNYFTDQDLMFAYNTDRSAGTLYLGKFNDGIV